MDRILHINIQRNKGRNIKDINSEIGLYINDNREERCRKLDFTLLLS